MEWLVGMIENVLGSKGAELLGVLYVVGIAIKGLCELVSKVIAITPGKKDDAWWANIMESKAFKLLEKVLDYAIRFKLPKKSEEQK